MFRLSLWLRDKLFGGTTKVTRAVHPWHESGGSYVAEYREVLDLIAERLSVEGQVVTTRFNSADTCAEFLRGGQVIAKVHMRGSEGAVFETIVRTVLPASERELFNALPRRKFEELAVA